MSAQRKVSVTSNAAKSVAKAQMVSTTQPRAKAIR